MNFYLAAAQLVVLSVGFRSPRELGEVLPRRFAARGIVCGISQSEGTG